VVNWKCLLSWRSCGARASVLEGMFIVGCCCQLSAIKWHGLIAFGRTVDLHFFVNVIIKLP
jgi:hypothetical protein